MQNTAHLLPPTFLKHPRLGAVAWVSLPLPLLVGGQGGGRGGDWPLVPGSEQSVVTLWWGRLWRIGVEAMLF